MGNGLYRINRTKLFKGSLVFLRANDGFSGLLSLSDLLLQSVNPAVTLGTLKVEIASGELESELGVSAWCNVGNGRLRSESV